MSKVFNDTTNLKGLVQEYELEISNEGLVSSNTTRLKQFAAAVNSALDDFTALAIQSSGTWQWDDSSHADFPIITTNLVSGQRDYTFTTDEQGNIILDIYKVLVADSSGVFHEIKAVDAQSQTDTNGFWDGRNTTGLPTRYDKTANGIFLDAIPNYNATNGLKVYINREASYFSHTDTTKRPGVPGIFHRYFVLRPAEDYARRNNLANYQAIRAERIEMEREIEEYFSMRPKDEARRARPAYHDNR